MTNAAESLLNAESAANALVAELERLKTAAESLETAHADSEQARRGAQDVVTTLDNVMPAVAEVNKQLQALDLPALAERLAGEITESGTALTQRLAGEIRDVTEPLNKVATRLETLPIEPAIQELDGKAESLHQRVAEAAAQHERSGTQVQTSLARLESLPAEITAVQEAQARTAQTLDGKVESLLQQVTEAAEQHDRSSAQVQTSLARLASLPAEVAAVQEAQAGIEQTLAANNQAALAATESLTQQIGKRDAAQAQELRWLTWKLAGVMIVGLVALAVFLWLTGIG